MLTCWLELDLQVAGNMSPERDHFKRKIVFQPSFFKGYDSFHWRNMKEEVSMGFCTNGGSYGMYPQGN